MCDCTTKKVITTEKAPKAIGPYSVATVVNHFVFTSGQIAINPATGNIVEGGIEAETRQALTNLKNVIEESGTTIENVMKTTVFLKDINDFTRMNAVYGEFFPENSPARSAVQVAALPKGALIEIEAIAVLDHCECCENGCDCEDDCDCEDGDDSCCCHS
jgi:2-iminobutanoate/2-iminopropanoate deaminase